jgi:hypothetical protein
MFEVGILSIPDDFACASEACQESFTQIVNYPVCIFVNISV